MDDLKHVYDEIKNGLAILGMELDDGECVYAIIKGVTYRFDQSLGIAQTVKQYLDTDDEA